jgi:hypothetical protein
MRAHASETATTWKSNEGLRESEIGNVFQSEKLATVALDLSGGPSGKIAAALTLARSGDITQARQLRGETFDETAPLLLRRAVSNEFPASLYIEDGSGRAVTFIANQHLYGPKQTLAVGYLGCQPDPHSSFMQARFRELLKSKTASERS